MKRFRFAGGRIVKTGVAIFLTAWICELLNWPPVFAVITAIVTIEPTVSDSKKRNYPFPSISHWLCLDCFVYFPIWQLTNYIHTCSRLYNGYLLSVEITRRSFSCNPYCCCNGRGNSWQLFVCIFHSVRNNYHRLTRFDFCKYVCFSSRLYEGNH